MFLGRLVVIRRERLVQRHVERLSTRPRVNQVDPHGLHWTPTVALNAGLSEEEREAKMDVRLPHTHTTHTHTHTTHPLHTHTHTVAWAMLGPGADRLAESLFDQPAGSKQGH